MLKTSVEIDIGAHYRTLSCRQTKRVEKGNGLLKKKRRTLDWERDRVEEGEGEGEMEAVVGSFLVICGFFILSLLWKAFNYAWLTPKRLERELRKQGIHGPPYKSLSGNLIDNARAMMEARTKPMELSHRIVPRVLPFIHQTMANYGKTCLTWIGPTPRVLITEPELIREILSNKFGHYAKQKENPIMKLIMGGLVSYEGEKWAKHRRLINPAFHVEKLKGMLPSFSASCYELINRWEKWVGFDESRELDVWPEIQKLTADVISRTAFGSSYEEGKRIFQLLTEQGELLIKGLQRPNIPGLIHLPTKDNLRRKEIDREIQAILRHMIENREKAIKIGEASNDDLLNLLLESNFNESQGNSKGAAMTMEEVIQECKLFYFAGQETTSSLLTWTMIALSMDTTWQQRAREEVLQVFGKNKPHFDGLSHLKIVTMILYEVLRLYPPAILLNRRTNKKMQLGGKTLPEDILLALPIILIHHDPQFWGDDADEFKPDRFAEGISKATNNQVSFFPFGWGPRICIGQNFAMTEAKLALVLILQHFSFELSPSYAHAPYIVMTIRPQHGAPLILHKL
ncbi:hypothetical protein ACLOJK_008411 [Asimina triloba]